jgi:hypothetical protein
VSEHTSHGKLVDFLRQFRRPYASIVCASALAGGVVYGVHTGNHIPEGLGWVLAAVSIGDIAARAAEKIRGA